MSASGNVHSVCADDLKTIEKALSDLPAGFRDKINMYYNIDDPLAFVSQCGDRALIEQLWAQCAGDIFRGKDPGNLPDFLALILKLYNAAHPERVLIAESPAPGSPYDYCSQERVASDGHKIEKLLLPGLALKNGARFVKACVRLTR
ncbi:MAG: hypothetical protein K2H64_09455 [Desulfovibrio sp.]|nr:hypothetical protein [Desulfovibrio sp.]